MPLNGLAQDDSADARLEQLEQRYLRAEEVLASATADFHSLRERSSTSERQLRQALQRVERMQQQLDAIQAEIDRLEEEEL